MSDGQLRAWATRASGIIGFFLATFYLAVIVGQDDGLAFGPMTWFILMTVAALLAWFADRAVYKTGRRMAIGAAAIFIVIGSLAVLTIGIGFLAAAVLSVVGITGSPRVEEAD